MKYLVGCWMFWYTVLFERNKTLQAYKISRFKFDPLLVSNGIWGFVLLYLTGAGSYNPVVMIAFGMTIVHLLAAMPFNRQVNVFMKSRFADNYLIARFQTWVDNPAGREEFLEELYLFERAAFDRWVAEGGPEQERKEKEEQRRKRKAEFEEIKVEFKNAWYEAWEDIKESYRQREAPFVDDEYREEYHSGEHCREENPKQPAANTDERISHPIRWALRTMELPPDTADFQSIRSKYRSLMKLHHPDKGGDEEKCKQLIDAYSILSEAYGRKAG